MARYKIELHTEKSADALNPTINKFLTDHGFTFSSYKNEQLWIKKRGAFKVPKFIKITYKAHALEIEAFVKNWLFPFVFAGENSISDKQDKSEEQLFDIIEELKKIIQ